MLTVADAHEQIRYRVESLAPRRLPLSELLGLRLAAPVTSSVDSPPFDKALVDGYAISTADRTATLRESELVTAGGVPLGAVTPGTTIRVMTGAPLPEGADAVVKWEDCERPDELTIQNPAGSVKPGANILRRGAAFHTGQIVLPAGKRLTPIDIALLAEIGQPEALAIPGPRVGVLPTGDELVAADAPQLAPGQIRNTNGPMLLAELAAAGLAGVDLGVGRDDPLDLRERIGRGLDCDVLLVSGGVSAGVKDLVPGVLRELGVEEVFHQVKVKPGKPLWFGVRQTDERRTLIFGLPGNPVSTLVAFKLFVLPALRALAGEKFATPATSAGALTGPFKHRGDRPTYHPCRQLGEGCAVRTDKPQIETLDWRGSADLATLTRADCLAVFPAGDYELAAGAAVEFMPL